jgi:hypothetical protein
VGDKVFTLNTYTYVTIDYYGVSASVNINCRNWSLGNTILTYNFQSYGLSVVQKNDANMLVLINLQTWDTGHYTYASTAARITKVNNYSFSIDVWNGNTTKNDYGASFTNYIDNLATAANVVGSSRITKWR